jgi:hypothetical protein
VVGFVHLRGACLSHFLSGIKCHHMFNLPAKDRCERCFLHVFAVGLSLREARGIFVCFSFSILFVTLSLLSRSLFGDISGGYFVLLVS